VEKLQEFSPSGLQDISIWIDKNPFFGLVKNMAASQGHICRKNVQIGGASLNSFFEASWLHAWKFSNHLELYNI